MRRMQNTYDMMAARRAAGKAIARIKPRPMEHQAGVFACYMHAGTKKQMTVQNWPRRRSWHGWIGRVLLIEARRRWREIDTPAGRVPALGEHSAALLAELGYSAADIARLRRERVI